MKTIYFDLTKPCFIEEKLTACIGYFDGIHKGHQKLIEQVLDTARKTNTKPALITFDPDPWSVLKGLDDIPHITPMQHRKEIGERLGIEYWIILSFQKEMAQLSYQAFHEKVLYQLNLSTLVCGYDFHYASKGQGSCETLLQQERFAIKIVEEVSSEHKKISSTGIEELLEAGEIEKANDWMGRYYEIWGDVKTGNQVGRTKGFPTANLKMSELYVIPKIGVYIGAVKVAGAWYAAMMNVGHNPTFNYQQNTSIEAHIFDFHKNIYQQPIRFRFFKYLRPEVKFEVGDELVAQLHQDEKDTRAFFKDGEESLLCD